mgnify:CR=1 FL=1
MAILEIKQILKDNKITQEEFAQYVGLSRVGLNKNLNHGQQKEGLIKNLNQMIEEKKKKKNLDK